VAGREEDLWVGIDVGTQGVRVLVASGDGHVAGSAARPLNGSRRGERHEQDAAQWWEATAAACREALAGVDPLRIRAVATDSTSGTILLLHKSGEPLTAAVIYDDSRAQEQARRADEEGEELWRSLGYRMTPSWGLPKLLWMLDCCPDVSAGARLAHACDFINHRLVGGQVATDWSHALKSGYDLIDGSWPHAVLDRLGVRPELLPEVVAPGTTLGEVGPDAADAAGIPLGTRVIAGMTDGCASQIAAGALGDGHWSSMLGTTLGLKGASSELLRDPNGVLYCHRSPDGGWLPGGACSAGAGVLAGTFGEEKLEELGQGAPRHEATEVLAYPLASRGERFPFDAPEAKGFLLGQPSDEAEHLAALLQGLAFVERLCFDYLDLLGAPVTGEIGLTGGAARSPYFCQLRADVLGRPVKLLEIADSAAGMAVLAASHGRNLEDTAAEMVRVREVIEPREDRRDRFLERYLRLLAALEKRGWLGEELAEHGRGRAQR
jgi:sugar (pentulose or hexulose) kinase